MTQRQRTALGVVGESIPRRTQTHTQKRRKGREVEKDGEVGSSRVKNRQRGIGGGGLPGRHRGNEGIPDRGIWTAQRQKKHTGEARRVSLRQPDRTGRRGRPEPNRRKPAGG